MRTAFALVLASAAVVFFLSGVHGCAITSDHFSCSVDVNGERVRCVDYTDVSVSLRATAEALCRGIGGDFNIDKTCPDEGKIGGCKESSSNLTQISWYYTSSIAKTVDDVMGRCSGPSQFVYPDGSVPDLAVSNTMDDLSVPQDLTSHD